MALVETRRAGGTTVLSSATSTPGAGAPGVSLVAIVEDDAAFRAWYDRTAPRVYAYLMSRCGSEQLAEELLQATFVEVVRNPRAYDGRADAVPWLIGIARHQLARHYRGRERSERWWRSAPIREIEVGSSSEAGAAHVAVDIRAALRTLSAIQQAALVFRFLDGLSVREVASHLGRSEDATESLLRRARQAFERSYRGDTRG
jgi:RNA polymerase sigma-70 factor (ECF subfamily)